MLLFFGKEMCNVEIDPNYCPEDYKILLGFAWLHHPSKTLVSSIYYTKMQSDGLFRSQVFKLVEN